MKRILTTLILLSIFLLYQIEAAFAIQQSVNQSFIFNHKNKDSKTYYSIISANPFCLPINTGDPKGQKSIAVSIGHNIISVALAKVLYFENHIYINFIRNYSNYSLNLLVHHRKKNMIFPFHYFW